MNWWHVIVALIFFEVLSVGAIVLWATFRYWRAHRRYQRQVEEVIATAESFTREVRV